MSRALDNRIKDTGTRFRIFPQASTLSAFSEPETLCVSIPPGEIHDGPADSRMFVVDAVNKIAYRDSGAQPPFSGDVNPAVEAGDDGHFDHLEVGSRQFFSATMYATVRRVLDIWEDYFGRRIEWFFDATFERLELIPLVRFSNAISGFGYLEFGFPRKSPGLLDLQNPYCANFDVLAHELGHQIVNAEVGRPFQFATTADYGGFHESGGDLVAIISSLHFNSVVDHLLRSSRGNLFTFNVLERVGELSESNQIRTAFNNERMSTVGTQAHDRSQPLTGAIFDIFVEKFQQNLVAASLITQDLADRSFHNPVVDVADADAIQAEFNAAFEGNEEGFKDAIIDARDYLGGLIARTWDSLNAHFLSYVGVAGAMLVADRDHFGGGMQNTIRSAYRLREITTGPDAVAGATFAWNDAPQSALSDDGHEHQGCCS